MRNLILCMLIAFPMLTMASEVAPSDTTIYLKGKKIVIKENNEKIKVKLYEQTNKGDTIENTQIFEGIYRDGKSTESRMSSINIPIPSFKSKHSDSNRITDPHWSGFGYGFANLSDTKLNTNKVSGVDLISSSSTEITLNFYEKAWNISHNGWAIVSGAGLSFNKYRVDGNQAFNEIDGVTQLVTPKDYRYSNSRLIANYFTIPLLLEYQKKLRHTGPFFISAGVVGGIKFYSASKVEYHNAGGKNKEKLGDDLNIRPINMDFLLQTGVGCFGIYAKYSPFTLFEKGKGPDVHPISMGFILHFN